MLCHLPRRPAFFVALATSLLLAQAPRAWSTDAEEIQKQIEKSQERIVKAQQQLLVLLGSGTTERDEAAKKTAQALSQEVTERTADLERFQQMLIDVREAEGQASEAEIMRLNEALEASRAQTAELNAQLAEMEREREAPAKDAVLRIFRLKFIDARNASYTISEIVGGQGVRTSVDDRANALVVSAPPDRIEVIGALLENLDVENGESAKARASTVPRSLLVRVAWLADGLAEGEGEDPAAYLPAAVLDGIRKLGHPAGRIVGQTISSVSRDGNREKPVQFGGKADAIIQGKATSMFCSGEVMPLIHDVASLNLKIRVQGSAVDSEVQGSLATPLGHFMVLGTANAVVSEQSEAVRGEILERLRAEQEARRQADEERGRGFEGGRGGGYGGRGGFDGGRGGYEGGRGGFEGAAQDEGGEAPAWVAQFKTSRFAFVVQVVEAESFAPEGGQDSE